MADYTSRNLKYRLYGPDNRPVSGATVSATLQLPGDADLLFGEDLPILEQPRQVFFAEDPDTAGLYSADLIPNTGNLENSRYRIDQQTAAGQTDFFISMPDEDVAPGATLEIEDIHEVGELSQEAVQPTVLRRLYNFLRSVLQVGAGLTITRDDANRRLTLNIQGGAVTTAHIAPDSVTKAQLNQTLRDEINDTVNDVAVSGRDVVVTRTGGGTGTGGTISPPSRLEVFNLVKAIFRSGTNTTFTSDDSAQTAQIDGRPGTGGAGTTLTADEQSKVKRLLAGTAGGTWAQVAGAMAQRNWAASLPAPPASEVTAASYGTAQRAAFAILPPYPIYALRIPEADKPLVAAPGGYRVAVAEAGGRPGAPPSMSYIQSAGWMHAVDSGGFAYYWFRSGAVPSGLTTTFSIERNPQVVLNDASSPASIARDSELPQPSDADPADLGTANQGTSDDYARGDHVHQLPDIPEGADDTDVPLVEGTAAVGTSARYARADHRHPAGSGGGGGPLTQAGVYAQLKAILQAGYRILVGHDDAKNETTISVVEVPSGATLPAKPWHLGQRFYLTADVTIEQDRQAVYLEAESGPTETVWDLPGLQLQIRAYGAGHTQAQLRNKVYLLRTGDYAFPPSGTITLTWYRTGQARRTYTVSRAAVDTLVHWHLINGADFATFGTTETQFGYLTNLQVGTAARLYPDAAVSRGDLIYTGGSENGGWPFRPGEAAPWARQGQPFPGTNLAVVRLLDGSFDHGISVSSGGPMDQAGTWFDLVDLDTNTPLDITSIDGSLQFTIHMLVEPNAAPANVGWDSGGRQKAVTFQGPVFLRDLRDAAGATVEIDTKDSFQGTAKNATWRLQAATVVSGAELRVRARLFRDGDSTTATYTVGPGTTNSRIQLWHQGPTVVVDAEAVIGTLQTAPVAADVGKAIVIGPAVNQLQIGAAPGGGGGGGTAPAPFDTVEETPAADVVINVPLGDTWYPLDDAQGNEVWQTIETISPTAAQAGRVLFLGQVHAESSHSNGGGDRIYYQTRLMMRSASGADSEHVRYIRNSGQQDADFQAITRIGTDEIVAEGTVAAGQHYDLQARVLAQVAQAAGQTRTVTFASDKNYLKMIPVGRAAGAASFSTRGPLWAESVDLPTAAYTSFGSDLTRSAGTAGTTTADAPSSVFWRGSGGRMQLSLPGSPPDDCCTGLWVTSEVSGSEIAAVFVPWSPGLSKLEGTPTAVFDDSSNLTSRVGLRCSDANPAAFVMIAVRVNVTGTAQLRIFSMQTAGDRAQSRPGPLLANTRVKIYPAGVYPA